MLTFNQIERLLQPYRPQLEVQPSSRHWVRPIVEQLLEQYGQVTGPQLAKVAKVTRESGNRYLRDFRDEGWLVGELVSVQHKSELGYVTTSRIAVYRVYEK